MTISASEARSRLFPLIQQVNDDHAPVRITSRGGDAVLMSAAIARDKESRPAITKTMDELEDLAGEV
jgi:antitoxin YefM